MECSRKIQKLSVEEDDGLGLFAKLMDKLEEGELLLVSCLARRIWLQRNSVVFGGPSSPPDLLVKSTTDSLEAFQ